MPAQSRARRSQWSRARHWAQTSFPDEAAGTTGPDTAPREIEEAFGAADHDGDTTARRDALDRLYGSLAQRAIRRGRTPVPKRSDPRGEDEAF
jgi:hypothetical protein